MLFIGGTGNIITDTGNLINKYYNETLIYDWIFETSGFAMVHHLKNFFIAYYLATSNLLYLSPTASRKIKLQAYKEVILKTLGWAALWEIVEKFAVFMIQILADWCPSYTPIVFFSDFFGTGEAVWNTILSDLPQSIIAATGVATLVYFKVLVPPSYILIEKRSLVMILVQFAWIGLSGLTSFLMPYKIRTNIGIIPLGFYSYFFVEIFFIFTLYLGDFYYLDKKGKKTHSLRQLNETYLILIFYVIIQFCATFNLTGPGFITSNVFYAFFVIILLSLKKFIN